jgi:pyruvate dehydrogenase E2 component (dihydrolipoamide acetyltransferase)
LSGADSLASESEAPKEEKPKEEKPQEDKSASKSEGKGSVEQTATQSAPPPARSYQESSERSDSKALPAGGPIYASPLAKKIAMERGIPLGKVKGTGPGGRIIREDIEKYKPESGAATSSASPASAPSADYVDTPVSGMRRTIGSRLTQSKQEIPHYYVTSDINMDKVMKLRQVFNKSLAEKDGGAKLSVNDFVVKAASCALADVPEANSAWLGETIRT